jgi:hypothetical protein
MNYVTKFIGILLVATGLAVGIGGCDSLTEGYDKDPNQPTTADAGLILNSAQVGTILYNDGNHARIAAIWSGHLTGADRQYSSLNNYNATSSDFDNLWITGYADVLGDLQDVKSKTRGSNPLVLGIAQVLEAYTFGTTTALHGDVPYAQAAAGRENLNPEFTGQSSIYQGVVDSLDAAIANLEAGGISPGQQDVFFNGDAQPWIEVAYTLKARFQLHRGNYEGALTAAQNGISSRDNNLIAPHGGSQSVNTNPFWLFKEVERSTYMTAGDSYAARLLDSSADAYRGNSKTDESARFGEYFITTDGGSYDMNTSEGAYFGQAADYALVTYAENELIEAEAELLVNGSSGYSDALAALNNARDANDAKLAPGTDNYEDYALSDFASGGLANDGQSQGNALLTEVLEEKYLTLMAHIETFNDVRRTDNFLGVPVKDGNELPQRFLIPQVEITTNDNAPSNPPGIFQETPVNSEVDYTGL